MSRAREILRDYLARRRWEGVPTDADDSFQEENLRRLLRHVAATHSPSEQLEPRLLQAMREAAQERQRAPSGIRAWPWLSPGLWRLAAPAAALVLAAVAFAWHLHRTPGPTHVVIRDRANTVSSPPNRRGPAPQTEAPLIGYVLLPEGELLRRTARRQEWQAVEGGDPVHLGDVLRTEADARASVVFLDGSDCRLTPDTSLRYDGPAQPDMKRPSHLSLTQGEAWFNVQKGGATFVVQAPAATAVVTGTFFGLTVGAKGATTLRVKEGAVRLTNSQGTVTIRAGLQSLAMVGEAPRPAVLLTTPRAPQPGVVAGSGTQRPPTFGMARTAGKGAAGRPQGTGRPNSSEGGLTPYPTIKSRDLGHLPLAKRSAHPQPKSPEKATVPMESGSPGGDEATRMPMSTSH